MDKKQRKKGILKGKTKGTPKKKTEQEENNDFKDRPFGGTMKKKNPPKLQENSLFGPFYKTKAQKHRENKTKPPNNQKTTDQKNTFMHFGKRPLIFGILFFFKLHSFMSAKLCLAENTIKIVFSAEHNFYVSQIVNSPFEAPSQNR